DAALRDAQTRLSERAAQLASAREAVAAKQGQLSRLRDRARTIAAAAANGEGDKRAAEVAVLESLARDAAAAQTSLAQLVATAMSSDGAAPAETRSTVRRRRGDRLRRLDRYHDRSASPLRRPQRRSADGSALAARVALNGRPARADAAREGTGPRTPRSAAGNRQAGRRR